MRFKLSEIQEKAKIRPEGYVADVVSYGTLSEDGTTLELSAENYGKLCEKYRLTDSGSTQPTLFNQIKSVTKAAFDWSKAGFKQVEPSVLEERLKICGGCEFWDSTGFAGTGRCQKCGCSTQAKLRMATEKCPIDKWGVSP